MNEIPTKAAISDRLLQDITATVDACDHATLAKLANSELGIYVAKDLAVQLLPLFTYWSFMWHGLERNIERELERAEIHLAWAGDHYCGVADDERLCRQAAQIVGKRPADVECLAQIDREALFAAAMDAAPSFAAQIRTEIIDQVRGYTVDSIVAATFAHPANR